MPIQYGIYSCTTQIVWNTQLHSPVHILWRIQFVNDVFHAIKYYGSKWARYEKMPIQHGIYSCTAEIVWYIQLRSPSHILWRIQFVNDVFPTSKQYGAKWAGYENMPIQHGIYSCTAQIVWHIQLHSPAHILWRIQFVNDVLPTNKNYGAKWIGYEKMSIQHGIYSCTGQIVWHIQLHSPVHIYIL